MIDRVTCKTGENVDQPEYANIATAQNNTKRLLTSQSMMGPVLISNSPEKVWLSLSRKLFRVTTILNMDFLSDLVYKFKKLMGRNDFSFQFRRIGYNLNILCDNLNA